MTFYETVNYDATKAALAAIAGVGEARIAKYASPNCIDLRKICNYNCAVKRWIAFLIKVRSQKMEIANRIMADDKIRFGKPVIKGTRVPVELIIGRLAGGMTYDELMSEYDLTKEDILAALDYAAKHLAGEEVRAIG